MRRTCGAPGGAISIHAPVKGATRGLYRPARHALISIHAPAKGATQTDGDLLTIPFTISIHAPVKGATYTRVNERGGEIIFQSTLP